jgi:hypothetical protein
MFKTDYDEGKIADNNMEVFFLRKRSNSKCFLSCIKTKTYFLFYISFPYLD